MEWVPDEPNVPRPVGGRGRSAAFRQESVVTTQSQFHVSPNPNAVPEAERTRFLESPGFGRIFTDHMVTVTFE